MVYDDGFPNLRLSSNWEIHPRRMTPRTLFPRDPTPHGPHTPPSSPHASGFTPDSSPVSSIGRSQRGQITREKYLMIHRVSTEEHADASCDACAGKAEGYAAMCASCMQFMCNECLARPAPSITPTIVTHVINLQPVACGDCMSIVCVPCLNDATVHRVFGPRPGKSCSTCQQIVQAWHDLHLYDDVNDGDANVRTHMGADRQPVDEGGMSTATTTTATATATAKATATPDSRSPLSIYPDSTSPLRLVYPDTPRKGPYTPRKPRALQATPPTVVVRPSDEHSDADGQDHTHRELSDPYRGGSTSRGLWTVSMNGDRHGHGHGHTSKCGVGLSSVIMDGHPVLDAFECLESLEDSEGFDFEVRSVDEMRTKKQHPLQCQHPHMHQHIKDHNHIHPHVSTTEASDDYAGSYDQDLFPRPSSLHGSMSPDSATVGDVQRLRMYALSQVPVRVPRTRSPLSGTMTGRMRGRRSRSARLARLSGTTLDLSSVSPDRRAGMSRMGLPYGTVRSVDMMGLGL